MEYNSNLDRSGPLKPRDPKAESLLMEKIALLQKEFQEIDVDHNNYLEKQELYSYLDRKNPSGKPFDRQIAQELFEHMDQNADGEITVNEFIKTYIEADEILRKKVETCKLNKEYYTKQYEDSIKKAEEAKQTERFTAAGITQGSVCDVMIMEGRSNRPSYGGSPPAYYVEASLDRQNAQRTKVLGTIDPKWNEKFTFAVVSKDSQLRLALYDQSRGSEFEGEAIIPLTELIDQDAHDTWIELFEKTGAKGRAQLHVKLQWIHSKFKYWTLSAQKCLDNIKKEEAEIEEYKRYIITLHEPFESLRKFSHQIIQEAEEGPDVQGITPFEGILVQYMKKAAKTVADESNPGEGFWRQMARLGVFAEAVVAVLIMVIRPDFFDLCVSLIALLSIDYGTLNELASPRIYSFLYWGSAVVLDLVWFFIYSGNWTNTLPKDANLELGSKRLALILTFVNIFYKVVLGAVVYMYHLQILKQKSAVPKIVIRNSATPN